MMNIKITLTALGEDLDNFNLLSDTDSFLIPFNKNITRNQLLAGYTPNPITVPNGTTIVRVLSDSLCTDYIDIPIDLLDPGAPISEPPPLMDFSDPDNSQYIPLI